MTRIWLGIGCDRGCSPQIVERTARAALAGAGLQAKQVVGIATIDVKADEPALTDLAKAWVAPLTVFPASRLERETPRLATPSETVFALMGCHGVAEAAALAAAGVGAVLMVPKIKGPGVTVAVAGHP